MGDRFRSSLARYVQSGPDPDYIVFEKLKMAWRDYGDEVIMFRRKDVGNDFKWQGYVNDAVRIYGKRG